jgi:hypothetical protein
MAYGVKYRIQYKNFLGELQRIDILFKNYSGTIEQVKAGATPLTIENNKDMSGDYLGGLVLTKYTVQGISSATFQSAFFTSEEYGDTLIAKYNHTNALEFYGVVVPFDCQDAFEADGTYTVSIGAECGLTSLKTIEYKGDDIFYTGRSKLIDIIYRCLNKLPYPTQFGLKSINNTKVYETLPGETLGMILESEQVNIDTDYYQVYVNNEAFQLNLYSYDNCYNVLKQVLTDLCELSFSNGFWWIRNIPELGQNPLVLVPNLPPPPFTYLTTYSDTGALLTREPYNKIGKTVGKTGQLRALKNGQVSRLFSQKDVNIKSTPGFLVNYLPNPNFADYLPIVGLVGWDDRDIFGSNVDSYSHGGSGTESDPYYYQINGYVISELFEGIDNQFIESSTITYYPYGRMFGGYFEPQNILISGKVQLGLLIKAIRLQVIVNYGSRTFYLNNDNTWQEQPVIYQVAITSGKKTGDFSIEPPTPPFYIDPSSQQIVDLTTLFPYYVTIRLFRGESAYSYELSNPEPTAFFVKYLLINVNVRPSVNREQVEGKEEVHLIGKYSDRKSSKTLEYKLGTPAYPYTHGSLFKDTTTTTPITGFAFFNDIVVFTAMQYDTYLAVGYLRVLGNRLSVYDLDLFNKVEFSDIINIDGRLFRITNLQYNDRRTQSKVKLIELDFNTSLNITTKFIQTTLDSLQPVGTSEIIKAGKEKLKPKGDNFNYTIDDLGLRNFKLSDDLKLTSINPRDNLLSLGNQESGTLTEVLGRFGVKSTNNFLGEFLIGENTGDRAYSFPDRDMEVNQWNDLSDVPESFPPDATYFKTDYGLIGICNGSNTVFETTEPFIAGTTRVYVNGIRQFKGITADYQELDQNSIEFTIAPESDDRLIIDYIKFT